MADAAEEIQCALCRDAGDGEADMHYKYLVCSHKFHERCWVDCERMLGKNYANGQLQCPMCKNTVDDIQNRENQLLDRPTAYIGDLISRGRRIAAADGRDGTEVAGTRAAGSADAEPAAGSADAEAAPAPEASISPDPHLPPAETEVTTFRRQLMSDEPEVFCMHCKKSVQLSKARIRNKTQGLFRCSSCHSKVNTMQRDSGWPPEIFAKMSEAEQEQFFRQTSTSKESLDRQLRIIERKVKKDEDYYDAGGQYLTESRYEKMGYSKEEIEHTNKNLAPSDKRWDGILEACTYRLPILAKGTRGSTGKEEAETIEGSFDRQRVGFKRGNLEAVGSDDESSDSTSSSHGDHQKNETPRISARQHAR